MAQSAFVFVSQPTALTSRQLAARTLIFKELELVGLEPRTVGVSDFAAKNPLHEVCVLAKHCSGGLVLGFGQSRAERVTYKPETDKERAVEHVIDASPWNQLEAGVLVAMRLPLLVLCESEINGGVFDPGASEHFVHKIDLEQLSDPAALSDLGNSIRSWSTDVWSHYRNAW